MRETNASALEYAQHYKQTWGRLMKKQERLPLEEYGNRSVLTTWTLSYQQVQRQSEAAASLLKLWGCLDSGELWYELIAAGDALAEETDVPAWLCEMAEDKLEFGEAAGLLCRYSLADATAESSSFSMHAVLHRWCGQLAEDQEQQELYCVAAGLVAEVVLMKEDAEYWRKRKRLVAHGISVSQWINDRHVGADRDTMLFLQPGQYYSLGYLLADEDRLGAVKLYERALKGYEKAWGAEHTSTLDTVNNLGNLYADLGQHKQAEEMYKRALKGYEKAWGAEHTSTLATVNNLGSLYADLGQYKQAEEMYKRALEGYTKALSPKSVSTYVPALNTMWARGLLSNSLGQAEEARAWYSKALLGYEAVFGTEHPKCQPLRDNLAALKEAETKSNTCVRAESAQVVKANVASDADASPRQVQVQSTSRRRRILQKLRRKHA
jgi:tetratricopeptide (TPR) repeat protein